MTSMALCTRLTKTYLSTKYWHTNGYLMDTLSFLEIQKCVIKLKLVGNNGFF